MERERDFPDLGVGLGLRAQHYEEILAAKPRISWFEALSENYLGTGGRPLEALERIATEYPVVLHGVSLGIADCDPLDWNYLRELRNLAQRVGARWVTDHLCWTSHGGRSTHELIPIPYTEEALEHTVARVREVQKFLGRTILLENPSAYMTFRNSTMDEPTFLRRLCEEAGCGLLLDVNNVLVNAKNHGTDPWRYVDSIPPQLVGQYHLAGHTVNEDYVLDSHIGPVPGDVMDLYRHTLETIGARSCLIEWDDEIPSLEQLVEEARRVEALHQNEFGGPEAVPQNSINRVRP